MEQRSTDEQAAAPGPTGRGARIESALRAAFEPRSLSVEDDSAKHAGHAGAQAGGETHYRVSIVADAFTGLSRVARHRAVNDTLASEFNSGLHALQVIARAPGET
jgi:BolA protein